MPSDSTLIPLDDRFALDPKRQCLIACTAGGEVKFMSHANEPVRAHVETLTVRGVGYSASGQYRGTDFHVYDVCAVDWLNRKDPTKAARAAVTALVSEALQEAHHRGYIRVLETHAAHWRATYALERLAKEREEVTARLAEIEAEATLARHVEMTTGFAVSELTR
jgi:hypothetical protein